MSDGITDMYKAEKELREIDKKYVLEIVSAEFEGKIVVRKHKEKSNAKWELAPRGKYNFMKYDYRIFNNYSEFGEYNE